MTKLHFLALFAEFITEEMSDTPSENEEVVKLNVGGRLFTTYKSTFMKYPDTMLARMFSTSAGTPFFFLFIIIIIYLLLFFWMWW